MTINKRKVSTRFMNGNLDLDGDIFYLLEEEYGSRALLESDFDTDNAIYSDGFINAVERGLIPELELQSNNCIKGDKEYHHVIINDECFTVFFKELN